MRLDRIETPEPDPLWDAWRTVRYGARSHAAKWGPREMDEMDKALAVVADVLLAARNNAVVAEAYADYRVGIAAARGAIYDALDALAEREEDDDE